MHLFAFPTPSLCCSARWACLRPQLHLRILISLAHRAQNRQSIPVLSRQPWHIVSQQAPIVSTSGFNVAAAPTQPSSLPARWTFGSIGLDGSPPLSNPSPTKNPLHAAPNMSSTPVTNFDPTTNDFFAMLGAPDLLQRPMQSGSAANAYFPSAAEALAQPQMTSTVASYPHWQLLSRNLSLHSTLSLHIPHPITLPPTLALLPPT
jgi:hypothetical protein